MVNVEKMGCITTEYRIRLHSLCICSHRLTKESALVLRCAPFKTLDTDRMEKWVCMMRATCNIHLLTEQAHIERECYNSFPVMCEHKGSVVWWWPPLSMRWCKNFGMYENIMSVHFNSTHVCAHNPTMHSHAACVRKTVCVCVVCACCASVLALVSRVHCTLCTPVGNADDVVLHSQPTV